MKEAKGNLAMTKRNFSGDFVAAVKEHFGKLPSAMTRAEILDVVNTTGVPKPNWLWNDPDPAVRIGRGLYSLSAAMAKRGTPKAKVPAAAPKTNKVAAPAVSVVKTASAPIETISAPQAIASVGSMLREKVLDKEISFVAEKLKGYVPFGHFADVRSIIKSKRFYPTFITGLSGNGKTLMVEQTCAAEKRELIRVNVTIETDEDDLIGGFRLIDGHTVWQNGPVILAMERGAVLLLDEIDLGSNKLMCLQPILEGKAAFLKKINKIVHPVEGFNIVATANTKGKGSEDGRFIGTNIMNEAFLDRFAITLEQEYPPIKTETKIMNNVLAEYGIENEKLVYCLVYWADVIRKSFYEGALQEIISTRRLADIIKAYAIFGENREKAITMCLARFDVETKTAFMELYKKVDESMNPPPPVETGGTEAVTVVENEKEFVF